MNADSLLDQWEMIEGPADGSAPIDSSDWIATTAPSDTYLTLCRAGRIGHPFVGRHNEKACGWVAERYWWWRARFFAAPASADERVRLSFEGLDTYADVWLNGEKIASSCNMFIPLESDIGSRLRAGEENELLVRFTPPTLVAGDREIEVWPGFESMTGAAKRTLHRKAQFGWGWDWSSVLPTVGIWRPVRLLRERRAIIKSLGFTTLSIAPDAEVQVQLEVEAFAGPLGLEAEVHLTAPDTADVVASARIKIEVEVRSAQLCLRVPNPQLWWTTDLGKPALYTLQVKLHAGSECLDQRELRVGLRTIELDRSPDLDEPGCEFFRFRLNGVDRFARGVNWVPASSFVAEISPEHYRKLIQDAATANINMIRVWGGGIYEHEAFYQACDELGLMVWQDFMFACAPYPENDPAFVASVKEEIEVQVRRLRNHPCLAIWCGENEGQFIDFWMKKAAGSDKPMSGDLYFNRLMPDAVRDLNPGIAYWPGSPYGGRHPGSAKAGDVHNWTPWHGMAPMHDLDSVGVEDKSPAGTSYLRYAEDPSRFISEFGIQSAAARTTLERWTTTEPLALDGKSLRQRVKSWPKDQIDAMLVPVTGAATELEQFFTYTQMLQAEGLKYGIEHYRRRMPHCSGTLVWQYNDACPAISWSIIDVDAVRKAAWYYVQRAYAPLLASFKQCDDGSVELWLTHDGTEAFELTAQVSLEHFDGRVIHGESLSLQAPANASRCVWRADAEKLKPAADRYLRVSSPRFDSNRLFFAPFKDLPLCAEPPRMSLTPTPSGSVEIDLSGIGYHVFVHFCAKESDLVFSENFFDLCVGETRRIVASAPGRAVAVDEFRLEFYRA